MKIIIVEPDKEPIVKEIENTLKAKQEIVGGWIQSVSLPEDDIVLICNEEGKIIGLPYNRIFCDSATGGVLDAIAGTFFLCSAPADSEDFESVPDALIDKYIKMFKPSMVFI